MRRYYVRAVDAPAWASSLRTRWWCVVRRSTGRVVERWSVRDLARDRVRALDELAAVIEASQPHVESGLTP